MKTFTVNYIYTGSVTLKADTQEDAVETVGHTEEKELLARAQYDVVSVTEEDENGIVVREYYY